MQRVLRNATLNEWERTGCRPPGKRPGEGDVIVRQRSGEPIRRYDDTPPNAHMVGDILSCCLYSGTGVEKIRSIKSAKVLVEELWREAAELLASPGVNTSC